MPLSDKTRKILWAKSGNLCAICHRKLVVDETELDSDSVVGEECHICAQSAGGPRFDQNATHTAEWLHEKRVAHEKWVEASLTGSVAIPRMRIVRSRANVPQKMDRITSGKALLNLASQCHSSNTDYDENLDDVEADLVAGFLQDVVDYAEMASDVDMAEHVRIARSLSNRLRELEESGFYLFAAVEDARVEGGKLPPSSWRIFHQTVTRATNPNVRWTDTKTLRAEAQGP
jgi:hypothetical protein